MTASGKQDVEAIARGMSNLERETLNLFSRDGMRVWQGIGMMPAVET